jgi:predicted deacylase
LTAPETPAASTKAAELASVFGCRVVIALEPPAAGRHLGESLGWNLERNLFVQATAKDIPAPIIEFGEAGRMEPDQVELGLNGIMRVLKHLDMTDWVSPDDRMAATTNAVVTPGSTAIRSTTQGLLHLLVRPGDRVGQGQLLARVVSLADEAEEIRSGAAGIVVRVSTDGVVTPSDRVVVLATV